MGVSTANDNGMEKSTFRTEVEVLSEAERDVQALARLGKKPILKVWSRLPQLEPFKLTTFSDASAFYQS